MAIVTLDGGQSSAALGGQTIAYIKQMAAQYIPGAPDTLIGSILTRVLSDFYQRSTAWRVYVTEYPVTGGQQIVQLNPVDQNMMVQWVLDAFMYPFNGANYPTPLYPVQRQAYGATPAPPTQYYMQSPDVMWLYPIPDKDYGKVLNIYASVTPTNLSAQLPDMSYTHHLDSLLYGVLSRLYLMSKRPWSDKDLGMMYEKKFRQDVMQFRDVANRGYGPADTRMIFPSFAGRTGSQQYPRAVA